MPVLRVVVPVLTVLATALVLAPPAAAAESTLEIRGAEYAATSTEGRFGGTALGAVPGLWLATVVHEPLRADQAVPITGGAVTLRGARGDIRGTFVDGEVSPATTASGCSDERFDVSGTLALRDGGRGSFELVLTHLRVLNRDECVGYGAVVAGSLRVPAGIVEA